MVPAPLKIAIVGTRGIPARYGGFETFAEQLSVRLAARGHQVTVYCRSYNLPRKDGSFDKRASYRGVSLVHLPTLRQKYLDTVLHTFLAALHSAPRRYDAVLLCNAANSIFIPIFRLSGKPVAINVDGIERRRKKWNALGRAWYRLGEWLAANLANRVVADAEVIGDYYRERYGAESTVIAYGSDLEEPARYDALAELGLKRDDYILYVSRLEPENNAQFVIDGFTKVNTEKKLAIVGDAPYSHRYIAQLKATNDPRVVFTGAVYGEGYAQLQYGASCYVQATEVGGSHPALLEAMGAGNAILANGTPENREVLGDAGLFYEPEDAEDFAAKVQRILDDADFATDLGERARRRAENDYRWEEIADEYEVLLSELTAQA